MPTTITRKMPRGNRCQRLRTSILDAKRENRADVAGFFRNRQHLRQQPYGIYHNETRQAVGPVFPVEKKQKKKQAEEKIEKQDDKKIKRSPVGEIVKSLIVSIPLIAPIFAACSDEKIIGVLGKTSSDRSGYYALAVTLAVLFVGAGIQSIAEKIKSSRKKPKENQSGEPPTNWSVDTE